MSGFSGRAGRGVAFLLVAMAAACEGTPPPPGGNGTDRDREAEPPVEPIVGGPCTYEPFEFRAVVDSAQRDGSLLVRPGGAVAIGNRCHLLRENGDGRWTIVAQGGRVSPVAGDTIVVSGEVIALGTCTPCSLGYELASPSAP